MHKILVSLFLLAAVAHAHAQDVTRDILAQPSMSVSEPGRRSAPLTVEPMPAPTTPVMMKAAPEPELELPAPIEEAAAEPETQPEAQPVAAAPASAVQGVKLTDILAKAYVESPSLRAEREVLRQQYENVARAESNRRPIVTADGGIAWVNADSTPGSRDSLLSRDVSLTATQFLYRGGRTLAEVEQQIKLSDAAIAAYDNITQATFLNVIIAAMDIQRDRATIDLTEQNRTVIARQLETAQHGFEVGELTRTDVAQSQARLSAAEAQLIAARADFSSAVARFRQYAGQDGADLVVDADTVQGLPATQDAAETTAEAEHPQIRTAREVEKAADSAIKLAEGGLLPVIYAQGGLSKAWEPSALIDDASDASLGIRASVPLYEAGGVRAQIRQAKYSKYEKRDRVEDAVRAVRRAVATAWNDYQAAQAQIAARDKQVEAATMARDGVYKEREVGARTVLDTLNADAELLDAQVGQVSARRDAVVAAYALMAATGQLTGEKLGLFDIGAEKAQMKAAQHKWLGTGADPVQ